MTHFWDMVDIVYVMHFSDITLLFEQWIIFKNLQFILLFLNIWTLAFTVLGLKTRFAYYWAFVSRTTARLFKVYFDFQNFHLTTRLRWPHYYMLWLVYLTLDSKLCKKNINNLFKKAIYKTRYKYFRSGIIYVQNWRVCELLKCILATQKQLTNRPQIITNQTDHRWTFGTLEKPWNI